MNRPRLCGQHKKAFGRKYRILGGEASCKRCLSSFWLYALVIINVDEFIYQFFGLQESLDFLAVDTLSFENREEIFCHRVIIAIFPS